MKKAWDLFIPWIIACLATVGSIFFSEFKHQQPCPICWYQRILLYPLVIILGIAAFRRAYRIILYVLPLTLLGLVLAIYHLIMIKFQFGMLLCAECVIKPILFNPVVFPALSFTAFSLVNLFLIIAAIRHRKSRKL